MIKRTARRGGTLPEVVTVAAVFLMLTTGLVGLGISVSRAWAAGNSKMSADGDASHALQKIAAEVRGGVSASVNTSGGLNVVMPPVNKEGDYNRFATGPTVTYYLSNGSLYRQQGTLTATVIGKKITALKFAVSGSIVSLSLTARQQTGTRVSETTYESQVQLRNQPPG